MIQRGGERNERELSEGRGRVGRRLGQGWVKVWRGLLEGEEKMENEVGRGLGEGWARVATRLGAGAISSCNGLKVSA